MAPKRKKTEKTPEAAPCCTLADLLEHRFFKALADPHRLSIFTRLVGCCGELTVNDVASGGPASVSVVSRHLAQLRDAGILAAEKCGREMRYRVRFEALSATLRSMADAVDACCPPTPEKKGKKVHAKRG